MTKDRIEDRKPIEIEDDVSTRWIARSIRSADSLGTTPCHHAFNWCSAVRARIITFASTLIGTSTTILATATVAAGTRLTARVFRRQA
jgi:hypothetical protein